MESFSIYQTRSANYTCDGTGRVMWHQNVNYQWYPSSTPVVCAGMNVLNIWKVVIRCSTYVDYSLRKDNENLWLLYSELSMWILVYMDNNLLKLPNHHSIALPSSAHTELNQNSVNQKLVVKVSMYVISF